MKIIIAKTTVAAAAVCNAAIYKALAGECNVHPHILQGDLPCFEGKHQRLHYSSTFECYEYEIDDAMLLRISALYVKVAEFVGPFIEGFCKLANLFRDEIHDVQRSLNTDIVMDVEEPTETH